jgi:two-component system, OmpR family, phosphate regulon sensor histidine kinase PhoR
MNLSLRWRVAAGYISLILFILAGLAWFLSNFIYEYNLTAVKNQLFSETRLFSSQAQAYFQNSSPDIPGLNNLASDYATHLNVRATLILNNGTVIVDTAANPGQMENHLSRPEVQQALSGNESSDIRSSLTVKMPFLYTASPIRVNNQIVGVARLAEKLNQIDASTAVIRRSILIAAIVAAILAILLSTLLTNITTRPLAQLKDRVMQIGAGQEIEIIPSSRKDEIGQLEQAFKYLTTQLSTHIVELEIERGKLYSVLANMTDGILIVDEKGTVQLINPAAERVFNITSSNALDKPLIEVVRNHQLVDLFTRSQQTGEQISVMLDTSPERLFIQAIATPLHQAITGNTLMVFQDLTRLRRLEMVRRDFVSNVSHELRTPLASLKALVDTLAEGALEDPPAARRFLLRMESEIDNLTQMVQELLELSRIESGRVPLERQAITPLDLLIPPVERMQVQAERAGLKLILACPTDLPPVSADPKRMEQVLVNLLHNAVKFTPPGGEIRVSAYQDSKNVVFTVKDTGVGIAPDALPRIFERFYKADRARSGGGTGLGLSIARHLVEAHGGRIWADSIVSQGSTFYFSLPLKEGDHEIK